ncbi:class I tRNA ligase family protein [Candidatus Nasuia deltocephalinicola]|uniref:class I tRNA ligase family protein n=1 Tax=Candidatus Nasuia deltocephalincola TaxID=1160784 RepID=UPI00216AFCA8|nr:class I tRNA ligase family protein [Candidatus Nasuia deltocephalinicola]
MFLKNNNFLSMIPYPSGRIHIGHIRNYIINDLFSRYFKYNFRKTHMFMGWDSYGTPAENASLIFDSKPLKLINNYINYMVKQIKLISFCINWKNIFKTCNYKYYYFDQFLILKILKKNLLYISNKKVNWDPCDKTILSDEQVLNGKGWRSGCLVRKKNILTYYLKIFFYKLEIYKELFNLKWPLNIKIMQKKWILKKRFFLYYFLFFLNYLFNYINELKNIYFFLLNIFFFFNIKLFKKFFNKKKLNLNVGVLLKNNLLIKLEIWNLKIKKNINFNYNKKFSKFLNYNNFNIFINYFLTGFNILDLKFNFKKRGVVYTKSFWNIKDWGISRQRFWGAPLPSFFCKFCNKNFLIKINSLPILIYKNLKFNKLFYYKYFSLKKCSICNNFSFKENYTIDTFFNSSWYYLKYFYNRTFINLNMPIDIYIGGVEHSILHLLYMRFITKFLRDKKYLNFSEPSLELFSQGMILSKNMDDKNYSKMSKSKKNFINPENIIFDYNLDSLKISVLKNSLNKDLFWGNNNIKVSFLILKFILNKLILKKNILFNKNRFWKYYIVSYNYKIIYKFLNKNFKKIINFSKNIKNNTNFLIFLIKIIKKIEIFKIINLFILKNIIFNFKKIINYFLPLSINIFWFNLKIDNIFKINYYLINFYKVFFLNIYFKKIFIVLNNKKIGNIFYKKIFLKKKILNFLFFKKNFYKKYILKIIKINKVLTVNTKKNIH